jgi:hypothetical protein
MAKSLPNFAHHSRMLSWVTATPLSEDQLDVAQAEIEHVIQPHCVTDDLRLKAMPGKGDGLWGHPASLAQPYSTCQPRLIWQCQGKVSHRQHRMADENGARRWLATAAIAAEQLPEAAPTTVGVDRESDLYDLFAPLPCRSSYPQPSQIISRCDGCCFSTRARWRNALVHLLIHPKLAFRPAEAMELTRLCEQVRKAGDRRPWSDDADQGNQDMSHPVG